MKTLLSLAAAFALIAFTATADAQCEKSCTDAAKKKQGCGLSKTGDAEGTTNVPAAPLAGGTNGEKACTDAAKKECTDAAKKACADAAKKDCAEACEKACAEACAKACDTAKSCDKSACDSVASVPLSKLYGNLMKASGTGCKSSGESLAAAKSILGVCCASEGPAALAKLEESAKNGCKKSSDKLSKLAGLLRAKDEFAAFASLPMSTKVEKLTAASKAGCEDATNALAMLAKGCESSCSTSLADKVKYLEGNAANGCATSQEALAMMEATMNDLIAKKKAKENCVEKQGCDKSGVEKQSCDKSGAKKGCDKGDAAIQQ